MLLSLSFVIGHHEGKETIILRDSDKNEIEYDDNTNTRRMKKQLIAYNKLLEKSFIDIQNMMLQEYLSNPKEDDVVMSLST